MLQAFTQIHWLAVLVATLAFSLLGGVWFAGLFGKEYLAALGRAGDPPPKPTPLFIAGPPLCGFVTATTSALLMRAVEVGSWGEAALFGVVVGVGYLVSTMTTIAINPNFPHPLRYVRLKAPYFLIASVVVSRVLYAMG